MTEFFRVFVDRCHHTKEETVLVPRLSATGLSARLEAEHADGRRLAYASAVALYRPGDRTGGAVVQLAVANYAAVLWAHIARENAELLPAVDRQLAANDSELVEAFERIETERIGSGAHERLHGMIETLAGRIAPFLPVAAGRR
ncbi:MAG: hemerythrin domain-containing protein [Chloroflexota bacterium]